MYLIFLLGTTVTTRMQTTPGVASSRQELKAAPGAAFSRQESPAVVRMKRFCLEFFFSYILKVSFFIFYLIPLTSLF